MKKIKQFIVVSGVLALCLATPALAATKDYVHFWSFDEGTGRSVGDAVGGQNAVLTGSSTGFGWASGKAGTAIAMNGETGEGIVLPDGFLKGSQGSISMWIDMLDLSDHNIIFSGRSTSDRNIYASLGVDRDGRPQLQFRDSANGNDRKAQGTRLIAKNEWVNLVLTANGIGYHLFVNGEELTIAGDNIGRWFPDFTNQTFMYRIGTLDANPMSGSFNGYIDDVKIFNRPLTGDEVTALYNEGNDAMTALPVAIAPSVTLSISSDHVLYGGTAIVNWTSANVDTCTANGGWSGDVATSGTRSFVKLSADTTYALTCVGKYGTANKRVALLVGTSTTPVISTTGALTVTDVTTAETTTVSPERKAQIDKLIAVILQLIAELQKQLAAMKSAGL